MTTTMIDDASDLERLRALEKALLHWMDAPIVSDIPGMELRNFYLIGVRESKRYLRGVLDALAQVYGSGEK